MSQSGTTHMGGGGGAGKVSVQDLFFAKYVDRSSPNLQIACCNGKYFKNALLTVRKAGERPLEYLKITLTEVIISYISTGGGGSERITEHIKLNFGEFKLEYVPQKRDGSGDAVCEVGWNIAKNIRV